MKKSLLSLAFIAASCLTAFSQTELFDINQVTLDSYGGYDNPVMTLDTENEAIKIQVISTAGYQWGNQAKITLTNVASAGLSTEKQYKLSFDAISDNADCGGVTLKFFDDNALFYTGSNFLSFSNVTTSYESDWIKPNEASCNGTIVLDFGWDPAQTITISNISFQEKNIETSVVETSAESTPATYKTYENGELIIVTPQGKFNLLGIKR